MPTEFTAQNGTEIHETTKITVTGCPKTKKKTKQNAKKATNTRKPSTGKGGRS